MRKVTIEISDFDKGIHRIRKAWNTNQAQGEFIGFESMSVLMRELTGKRWEIIHLLQEKGTMSIRKVARQLGRDVKNIHTDIQALIQIGLVEQSKAGVCVPFDEIKMELLWRKAA